MAIILLHWNPHQKLEFMKCMIRSIYIEDTQKINKRKNFEREIMRKEIEYLNLKLELETNNDRREIIACKLDILQGKLKIEQDKIAKEIAEKIKTKWYNEGERSTKYFLNQLKSRTRKQKIMTLNDNGRKINNPEEIERNVFNFYQDLYTEKDFKNDLDDTINEEALLNLIDELDNDQILALENKLENKELLSTLKSTRDSAPGPDGITYSFIKFLWPIYGKILIESWNYSLITGKLPPSHNSSTLTLLPKEGKNLEELKNWRPITLSNCDLKLITKTLSKQMTKTLDEVIKDHQSYYMENRTISDNLRIINLSLREAESTGQPVYVVALDAKKAFDSVRHSFIHKILTRLGLHGFSEIFKILYHEQNIRINLNGKYTEQYFPTRGVKQGDALSCIIFLKNGPFPASFSLFSSFLITVNSK